MEQITRNLRCNRSWLLAAAVIHLVPVLFICAEKMRTGQDVMQAAVSVITVFFSCLVYFGAVGLFAVIRPSWPARTMMALIMLCTLLVHAADLFVFLHYGCQIQLIFLELLLCTNVLEAAGFLKLYCIQRPEWPLLIYFGGCAAAVFALFRWKKHAARIALLCGAVMTGLLAVYRECRPAEIAAGPYHSWWQMCDAFCSEQVRNAMLAGDIAAANANIRAVSPDRKAVYILVIGESHSRAHSSLYGYFRRTNPELEKLQKQGNLCCFRDTVSPHSFTSFVMLKLLTYEAHDSGMTFEHCENLFDLMRAAGFKTWFLCNQNSVEGMQLAYYWIIRRADVCAFTPREWKKQLDEALFPLLDQALNDPADKKFIVLQLQGSHAEYSRTYPDHFAVYRDEVPMQFNPEQKSHAGTINDYDNSLRYNDFILSRMIGRLPERESAFLLYLADHGENLWEFPGCFTHMDMMPTPWSVEIPMFLYTTPAYHAAHPGKTRELLMQTAGKPFNSENLPHLLLGLTEIRTPGYDPTRDPATPLYRTDRKRVVSAGKIDYEKLKKARYEDILHGRGLQ